MIHTKESLRPTPTYPTYPPYHVGDYLEDYFYRRFSTEVPNVNRDYIAISWTTLYVQEQKQEIQPFLDSLDPNKKYFTVLQHDDAPLHKLPKDTICFGAGGNYSGDNVIPIPLVCSKLPISYQETERPYFVSFVGSNTHNIRVKTAEHFLNRDDCKIYVKGWSPNIPQNDFVLFVETAIHSKYFLCPRGYGLNSFRLYEVMQMGCVPVIITDKFYLPWQDELDWNEFAILIHENELPSAYEKLKSISEEKYLQLKEKIKEVYPKYFTLEGMYNNIIKRISI